MSPRQLWVLGFVELFLEVEAGRRPARHLRPLIHTDLFGSLRAISGPGATEIVRIRTQTREDVCEAVVVLGTGDRVSALAVSVRRFGGRWQVTEASRPETPPPPPPGPEVTSTATPTEDDLAVIQPRPGWQLPPGWHKKPAHAA